MVMSVLFSYGLGNILGAMNTLQINVLQILFRLDIPINLQKVLGPILRLSNFDLYKTDDLYELIFEYEETPSFD